MALGGFVAVVLATLVLSGWILRVEILVTALPGLAPMAFNTAVCLALLGVAAVLIGAGRSRHPLTFAAAAGVIMLAGLAFVQHALGTDLGVDTLFHRQDLLLSIPVVPGRMAPVTATALLVLALVVVLHGRGGKSCWRAALVLSLLVAGVATFAMLGYAGRRAAEGVALHAAACLLLLSTLFALEARRLLAGARVAVSWGLALGAAALLLLTVGWAAHRGLDQVVSTGRDVARTVLIDNRLRDVQVFLTDLEIEHHAGLPADLVRLRALLGELNSLITDPRQTARARRLTALAEESVARIHASAAEPAERAREARAELHELVDGMLAAEAELLRLRQARGARAVAEARGVILLGLSLALLLGAGAALVLRRILSELRESRERYASIFASVAEGLVLQDERGVILECNSAAERVLGLTVAQLTGPDSPNPCWRAMDHDVSPYPGDIHPAMLTLRDGQPRRDQIMGVRRPDGSLVWISVNAEAIRDAAGRVRAVVTSFFDITARRAAEKALRESEERFRNTFEHAGIGMAIVGLDGRWRRVNAALLRLFGYDEPRLLATTFQDITHPDDLHADLRHVERLLAGETTSYQMEKRYFHNAGHVVWIHLTVSLVRDAAGAPVHFVSQLEDITERKRAEERLAAYAARLAARNRELHDFAYVASHDLQEPLRKIQAFGDRLDRRAGPDLAPEDRDYLTRMRAAAARMSALLEALLAYSRVASQARAFTAVPLEHALRDALQDLELRVEKTGACVEVVGALPELQGDPVLLRQLFQNLLGNAFKYHRPGVPPLVRVSAVPCAPGVLPPAAGPGWEIRLEDNGIGFEPRHAEAIFGVFHRLHAQNEYEGAGVGLAICRRIVERHGGLIRAEGRPGEGATFVVTLPAAAVADGLDALDT